MWTLLRVSMLVLGLSGSFSAMAQFDKPEPLKVDQVQVDAWNDFADALYRLHQHQVSEHNIRTRERIGGYEGSHLGDPEFYREVRYFDAASGRLLSTIQWERERPDVIHMIEVLIYDDKGRVERDYLAAFLPQFRNAPVQTLINFHRYEDELHGFRQFDASGNRIHEQCRGSYFGEKVFLLLDESDMPPYSDNPELFDSPVYVACFEHLPLQAGRYLDPLKEIGQEAAAEAGAAVTDAQANRAVAGLTQEIEKAPSAALYLKRGRAYVDLGLFDDAVADFDAALRRNDLLDDAHFWRGMALGRMGKLDASIAALDTYISRNPTNSVAYTKRGVRHIWNGDLDSAERDLKQAIALDPRNAEAHDDLGVIYAHRKDYDQALKHFGQTVSIDPSYQKGHHNQAMALYLTGQLEPALRAVNESQRLAPNDRSTVLLKGQILQGLGREQQAQALFERAEFMAEEKNWTEQFSLQ